jgi:hypothetical protein
VELDLIFDEEPALAGVHQLGAWNTGFDFSPPEPEQERALGEVDRKIQQHPTLRAPWASTPAHSSLHLHCADLSKAVRNRFGHLMFEQSG